MSLIYSRTIDIIPVKIHTITSEKATGRRLVQEGAEGITEPQDMQNGKIFREKGGVLCHTMSE